ncbi:MAG: hypothetical protein RIK87_11795 [Fuerstiella sp.]
MATSSASQSVIDQSFLNAFSVGECEVARLLAQQVFLPSVFLVISVAQFVLCFSVSIALYPVQFSLSTNYISEPGCAKDGHLAHAWVFNISLAAFAVCLCYYFVSVFRMAIRGPVELMVIGGSGLLSSSSVFFIAVLPWNSYPGLHTLAMFSWLLFLLPAISIWIEWLWSLPSEKARHPDACFALGKSLRMLVVLFPVAGMLGVGPAMQKVLVLLCLSWIIVFCFQLQRALQRGLVKTGFAGKKRRKTAIPYLEPGTFDGSYD